MKLSIGGLRSVAASEFPGDDKASPSSAPKREAFRTRSQADAWSRVKAGSFTIARASASALRAAARRGYDGWLSIHGFEMPSAISGARMIASQIAASL